MQVEQTTQDWLLMLKSEEEIEQVAQEEISTLCGSASKSQKLFQGVVQFSATASLLSMALGLELLGSLYVIIATVHFKGLSSTGFLDAVTHQTRSASLQWIQSCRDYIHLRGGLELPSEITFKTYYRCLQGAQPADLPIGRDLMAAVGSAIQATCHWQVNLQSPHVEIAIFSDLATQQLFVAANLTRHRKGKIVSSELIPSLSRAQNEDYCKRVLARLRKRRREKKELDESPQTESAAEGGTAAEQAAEQADPQAPPRRLMKAEAVLQRRTSRIIIILEKTVNEHNHYAVLRTAECFGIQHVWFVLHPTISAEDFHINRKITKQKEDFLSIRTFNTTAECIDTCRREAVDIWATDLSLEAVNLDDRDQLQKLSESFPRRVGLVIGSESTGITQEMLAAANRRLYYPLQGFSESLNLSVATALIIQRLFDVCPSARGDMSEEERKAIRADWYAKLAHTAWQRVNYPKWAAKPPPPLNDLRRLEEHRTPWLPPKILNKNTL